MTFVDVENLLSVPDHSLQVARQDNLVVSGWENLSKCLSVFAQLLPFSLDLGYHLKWGAFYLYIADIFATQIMGGAKELVVLL